MVKVTIETEEGTTQYEGTFMLLGMVHQDGTYESAMAGGTTNAELAIAACGLSAHAYECMGRNAQEAQEAQETPDETVE
jgi:hypothetical protein